MFARRVLLGALVSALAVLAVPLFAQPAGEATVEVFFSPRGGVTAAVVRELSACRSSALVEAYELTSAPIAEAVVSAALRHVFVAVLVDDGEEHDRWSLVPVLLSWGVVCRVDHVSGLSHNKVMILDGAVVLTGSFNWTGNAESRNAENLAVLRGETVAAVYGAEFWRRMSGSREFVQGGG